MSERKHTPEPWRVGNVLSDEQSVTVDAPNGDDDLGHLKWTEFVTCAGSWDNPAAGMRKACANAGRIVTCVNACTGAPASIKPGSVVAMAQALEDVTENLEHARMMVENTAVSSMLFDSIQEARAALAMYNGEEG